MKASAGDHVLMIVENNPFGIDVRVRQEANALTEAGYQVTAICPSDSKWHWRERIDEVWVYSYPAPLAGQGFIGYLWEYSYSLAATFFLSILIFISHKFDFIHAANPPDTIVFVAAFYKVFGVRFIFDHHDIMPEMYEERFHGKGNRFIHNALLLTERLSCQMADGVVATNLSYKRIEIERDRVPEDNITIVRNGPLLEKFKPVAPDAVLKEKAGTILGFVGLMAPQDGLDYLLRALYQLAYVLGKDDFYCVIIGKGSAMDEMKQLVKELKIADKVMFTGFIPEADKFRYLSTVDICMDPDPSNAFNDRCTMIKMMEYMAMGKPIVAFDLPEHRVTAGDAALYAQPNDELDFARKIACLMEDISTRKAMGQFGRKRVENVLCWAKQKTFLLEAYEKARQN